MFQTWFPSRGNFVKTNYTRLNREMAILAVLHLGETFSLIYNVSFPLVVVFGENQEPWAIALCTLHYSHNIYGKRLIKFSIKVYINHEVFDKSAHGGIFCSDHWIGRYVVNMYILCNAPGAWVSII